MYSDEEQGQQENESPNKSPRSPLKRLEKKTLNPNELIDIDPVKLNERQLHSRKDYAKLHGETDELLQYSLAELLEKPCDTPLCTPSNSSDILPEIFSVPLPILWQMDNINNNNRRNKEAQNQEELEKKIEQMYHYIIEDPEKIKKFKHSSIYIDVDEKLIPAAEKLPNLLDNETSLKNHIHVLIENYVENFERVQLEYKITYDTLLNLERSQITTSNLHDKDLLLATFLASNEETVNKLFNFALEHPDIIETLKRQNETDTQFNDRLRALITDFTIRYESWSHNNQDFDHLQEIEEEMKKNILPERSKKINKP